MGKTILHLCADIGSDSYPYKQAGYNVVCIGKDIGVENYHPNGKIYGVIANPVCTEFSIASGFHHVKDYEKGLFLVRHCQRIIEECPKEDLQFYVIENPASGKLKDYLGKPDYVYEPWWYGDPWSKKTALWGKFNIPQRKYMKWQDVPKNLNLYVRPGRGKASIAFLHKSARQYIENMKPFEVENDADFRSICPQEFAHAFFESNK